MAVNTKTFTFSKNRVTKIIALYERIKFENENPSLRYPAFNTSANATAYTEPDTAFFTAEAMKRINSDDATQPNAPNIDDFMDLMLFIEAVNAGDAVFPSGFPSGKDDFKFYVQKPFQETLNKLQPHVPETIEDWRNRRQLANAMLDELTRYSERSFDGIKEQVKAGGSDVSDADKKTYELFASMHAHALSRVGSGRAFTDTGESSGGRALGVLLRAIVILPFYPLFILIGAGFSLTINGSARFDENKTTNDSYTSRFYGILSGITYRMGDAGEKYWAQAGLNMPKMRPWDTVGDFANNLIHYPIAVISIGLTIIPEFVSKSILWPFKAIVGYDRLATDSFLRQGINGVENTLTGILSSPMILLNNLYRAVLDVADKTFTMPENDPDLKAIEAWLKKNDSMFQINLNNPDIADWIFIGLFKVFRLLFDTIPAILSNTIVGTLRSIFPAMPGTTKEFRNTFFKGFSNVLYMGFFALNALFFSGLFLAGIGVAVPGWLGVIFGYDAGMGHGAGQFLSAYGNQIWNVMQTAANGIASFFTAPAQAISNFFMSNLNPAKIGNMFSQGGLMGPGGVISNAFLAIGTKAEIAATVIGSVLGTAVLYFVGSKAWKAKEKKSLATKTEEALIVSVDKNDIVRQKVSKADVLDKKFTSTLLIQHPRDTLRNSVAAKNADLNVTQANMQKESSSKVIHLQKKFVGRADG